jgi:hypothetical protein
VAQASAEAFEALNAHLTADKPSMLAGLLKGNARFLDHLSRTTEKIADRVAAEKKRNS